jgi:hypothetical protein
MTSVRTRHLDGPAIGDTTSAVTAPIHHGGLPTEPAAWVGSGRRHLDKRRRRRAVAQRRAAQRAPGTGHSGPRHAAGRHAFVPAGTAVQPAAGSTSIGRARIGRPTRTAGYSPAWGASERTTRRVAAVLVALTFGYGVTVGVLLSPRSGSVWNSSRQLGHAPAGIGGPTAVADQEAPRTDSGAGGLAGPAPLPAEVAPTPVGLSIPAIGVDEPTLIPLGRTPDGTMQVPEDYARAGWFTGGPTPGTAGPAVIAGHVDSRSGPAVFFRLRQLKAGDVITERQDHGHHARFVEDGVALYAKHDFPTETVFGAVPGVALRLITCGGTFDRVARSYRSNVVVYASQRVAAG